MVIGIVKNVMSKKRSGVNLITNRKYLLDKIADWGKLLLEAFRHNFLRNAVPNVMGEMETVIKQAIADDKKILEQELEKEEE